VGSHGPNQIVDILRSCRLKAGVHGQLSKTNIHSVYRYMGVGDVPQSGAAGHVGAVGEVLDRHLRPTAESHKDCLGRAVGGVADAMLDDHAAVHHRTVGGIGIFRVIGVDGVGIVGGHQEAIGDGGGAIPPQSRADSVHYVA